ncbi:hypothetical protein AB4Z22_11325 [Paenibacillus sp. TAF58]
MLVKFPDNNITAETTYFEANSTRTVQYVNELISSKVKNVSPFIRLFFIVTDDGESGSAFVTMFFKLADEKRADL